MDDRPWVLPGSLDAAVHTSRLCLLQSARAGTQPRLLQSGWQRGAARLLQDGVAATESWASRSRQSGGLSRPERVGTDGGNLSSTNMVWRRPSRRRAEDYRGNHHSRTHSGRPVNHRGTTEYETKPDGLIGTLSTALIAPRGRLFVLNKSRE